MTKFSKYLLLVAMICAVALCVVSAFQYLDARRELSELKSDLSASNAAWNAIDENKQSVLTELKRAKNELRDADLIIQEAEEKTEELEKDIEILEKDIEALSSPVP